jgi:SSS family solute:Na+ symporter
VVIPGIIAYVMNLDANGDLVKASMDPTFLNDAGGVINDNAAPWLISRFVPAGLKGLVVAALAAAIVSSLASMLNSTSTIFTMDIYKPYINPNASETKTVNVGRITAAIALVIAVFIAPSLGNLGQVFQYIQEYTGIVSPGILAVFLMGLFSKKATNNAAIWGVVLSIPIAMYFKFGPNGWADGTAIEGLFISLPFMHQMLITTLASLGIIALISRLEAKGADNPKAIVISKDTFKTDPVFNISAVAICIILAFLYAIFW